MTLAMSGETVLVTGATGYIGSVLLESLRTDNDVHALVRDRRRDSGALETPGVRFHTFGPDLDEVETVVDAISPGVLFHLATLYSRHDPASVSQMVDANVKFGAAVLNAVSHQSECDVVLVGSHFQFVGSPPVPSSLYAATKNALCEIAAYFGRERGMRWIQAVLYDVYGPGDPRPKLVTTVLNSLRTGEPLSLPEPQPLHHFVYVDDVVEALIAARVDLCSDLMTNGRSVFVTSNRPATPEELLATASRVAGVEPTLSDDRFKLLPGAPMRPIDGPRPKDWQPTVDLATGIERIRSEKPF